MSKVGNLMDLSCHVSFLFGRHLPASRHLVKIVGPKML